MYPGTRSYSREWVVNNDVWDLKFVRKIPFVKDADNVRGLNDPGSMTIFIQQKLSRKETLMTFFHEIIHAIEYSYDLPERSTYTYRDIHKYIHEIEKHLAEFFVNNFENLFVLFFRDF